MACSTIVEHSQQGGFTECCCQEHVQPPTWRRTSDLKRSETTRASPSSGRWKYGREMAERILPKSDDFHATFWVQATTWDRRLYFPSEGRRAEDFFARKIRRLRPGLNPRTWVPKASTLPPDHRSRSHCYYTLHNSSLFQVLHGCHLPFEKGLTRSKTAYFKEYYQKGEINYKIKKGGKPDSKLYLDLNHISGAVSEIPGWILTHVQRDGKNLKVGET